jgi:hypothetical protein
MPMRTRKGLEMCHAVRCRTCGLVTWRGCGRHVEQVLASYPRESRCEGHDDEQPRGLLGWFSRR